MSILSVILDTDPGVDDALAMMLALSSPELEVLGVSVVSGNVPLATGTENALKVLGLMGRTDIGVYVGADRPLVRDPVYAEEVHGNTGLGQARLPDPGVAVAGDGVAFLVETLTDRPGEVMLIAVGPLTNLALAEQQSPGVLQKAKQVIVMGGAIQEPGNATPTAEFNFYADPDAARGVIQSGAQVMLVPLDVTHQVILGREMLENEVAPKNTDRSRFLMDAVQDTLRFAEQTGGREGIYLHDPLAVGVAVAPELFEVETMRLDVETQGELTAGQVVADLREIREERQQGRKVHCTIRVDCERFLGLFLKRVLEKGPFS